MNKNPTPPSGNRAARGGSGAQKQGRGHRAKAGDRSHQPDASPAKAGKGDDRPSRPPKRDTPSKNLNPTKSDKLTYTPQSDTPRVKSKTSSRPNTTRDSDSSEGLASRIRSRTREHGRQALRQAVDNTTAGSAARVVGRSRSDGTIRGDVREVSDTASTGAKLGTTVGGPIGTAVGAVAGGVIGGLKTKRGRRVLAIHAGLVAASVLAVPIAITVMLSMLITSVGGGISHAAQARSTYSALADGVDGDVQAVLVQASDGSIVPWELLAAIVKVNHDQGLGGVGVFGIRPRHAEKVGLDAENIGSAAEYVTGLLADSVGAANKHGLYLGLDAGLLLEADGEELHLRLPPNSGDLSPPSADDSPLAETDDTEAHLYVRQLWTTAIGTLPLEGIEDQADRVYDTALSWVVGQSVSCHASVYGNTASNQWVNPLKGRVTSQYGSRFHPVLRYWKLHDGTDIAASAGTAIVAASSGTVEVTSTSWAGPNMVTIDHGGGVRTVYGHMDSATVKTGDQVGPGVQVGTVGSQGYSTGPHLHFTVYKNGQTVDPMVFMRERGVNLGADRTGPVDVEPTDSDDAEPDDAPDDVADTVAASDSYSGTSITGVPLALEPYQMAYAAQIATAAHKMGLSADAIVIAYMTVAVESRFLMYANSKNPSSLGLDHDAVGSDHDSVGLFQQRDSWGSTPARMDAEISARLFFERLVNVKKWRHMAKGDAAQTVQVSAFPDRYAEWEQWAEGLYEAVEGTTFFTDPCSSADTAGAIAFAMDQVGKKYSQTKEGGLGPNFFDCSGLVKRAFERIGVVLPRTSVQQSQTGAEVSGDELRPGDLIFYFTPVSHVAIYLGEHDGVESTVHAANPDAGVKVSPRSEMQADEVSYRRVLESHMEVEDVV